MPASLVKIKSSNDHITLPCHSSFIRTSFQLHLDLIGLLHGPVHAHASLCMTLPILEETSSVQITLQIAINRDPLSSFQRILARQLYPHSLNPQNSKENLIIFIWKLSLNLTVWRFKNSRIQSFVPLPNHCCKFPECDQARIEASKIKFCITLKVFSRNFLPFDSHLILINSLGSLVV